LQEEKRSLESASDLLRQLSERLREVTAALKALETQLEEQRDKRSRIEQRQSDASALREQTQALLLDPKMAAQTSYFERLEAVRREALGEHQLSVESCENRQQETRVWLQTRMDAEARKLNLLRDRIIQAMVAYKEEFKLDTAEVDASIEAVFEYRNMLDKLQADDLPRFEARFKELLNENTIREVANFNAQLAMWRETIRERIARINTSLTQIDYNPGRYIALEAQPTPDADIRDFQSELRACTEGSLTGSEDAQYSEAKFLQVRQIIERLRGREGSPNRTAGGRPRSPTSATGSSSPPASAGARTTASTSITPTRAASRAARRRKLAYTILAASLAYQFGLEWGAVRSRSFRFVVIDEAFGRGSDESAQYGLRLFAQLNLQLLIVTPLQKIHIIEPFVSSVGFVHNEEGAPRSCAT
jgi:uncharacterized protein YPO0396